MDTLDRNVVLHSTPSPFMYNTAAPGTKAVLTEYLLRLTKPEHPCLDHKHDARLGQCSRKATQKTRRL